jgi:3-dehydroquinate synthase
VNSEKIEICGAGFRYAAHVGCGLIGESGHLTREVVRGDCAAIITDANIPRTLIDRVAASLAGAEFRVTTVIVPPGENSKSLSEVERVSDELSSFDRSSVVVGVGGGMVSDLSGFVAAVFHRGIPHVQIPTTLLAMVDSAIGGKTGVNLAAGKNLVGAIHHPALVIADVEALATLPTRELRQGCAEIVKHAIIRDAGMFALLRLSSRAPKAFGVEGSLSGNLKETSSGSVDFARDGRLIARNIRIKASIISDDDHDISGERAVLNFGHTVGHGIERASDFGIPHGECVSLGMVASCEVSVKRAGLPANQRDEILALLKRLGLPTQLGDEIAHEKIIKAIARDKKFQSGGVRFVVTPRIGEAYLSRDVTLSDLEEAVSRL